MTFAASDFLGRVVAGFATRAGQLGDGTVLPMAGHMDPMEALRQAELTLRNLVRAVLGDAWREVPGLPSDGELLDRKRGEESHRAGVRVSQDPLDYLFIGELANIYQQRLNRFGEVFPAKGRFKEFVRILTAYRNTPSHFRNLSWFEADLVTGASGWIVAVVTRWRNETMDEDPHPYPEILAVADTWNNQFVAVPSVGVLPYHSHYGPDPEFFNYSIDLGQTVHIECQGADADSRDLVWRLYLGGMVPTKLDEQHGDTVTFAWTPGPEAVGQALVYVTLSAVDEFPRRVGGPLFSDGYDAVVVGRYQVKRPRKPRPPASFLGS